MAWSEMGQDRIREALRQTIGVTMGLSQLLTLAPYPLSILQDDCSTTSVRARATLFVRTLFSFSVIVAEVVSLFVVFFYYPHLLYPESVPIFIKILYYIVNAVQIALVGNLLMACERRRDRYEHTFAQMSSLLEQIANTEDCSGTIWHKKTIKVVLALYISIALLIPVGMVTAMGNIGALPFTVAYLVPYTASFMILIQYYECNVYLWAILHKLDEELVALGRGEEDVEQLTGKFVPNRSVKIYYVAAYPHFGIIERLRQLHINTMEIVADLNCNFGFVIILIVVAVFASVNIELLEVYQCIKDGTLSEGHIALKFLYTGARFSFYILIAYPNRLIQTQNERTIFHLFKIRRASCSEETNATVRYLHDFQIEHYIGQISNLREIHQACGMINLDMKLLSNKRSEL
ncbi:uncharacterized protein LOC131216015 [Anopheles bellator]|uniref:uncharacterized protein LOC131216015 n=1 Tax=Anopheles bellator TaxID=139047 RepID=UPI002649B40B|nr:uncharacterized protein LOC131216015 [Anopheles bellator]